MKRFDRRLVGHLSRDEIEALLAAPDPNTWCGQRDRVLFATLYNTGARVSELIHLRVGDVVLGKAPCAHIHGKARKQRTVPLWRSTASQIKSWLQRNGALPDQMLFPNRSGNPMTRSNVTARLKLAVQTATRQCPQLSSHPVSPHVIRHYLTFLIMSGDTVELPRPSEDYWLRGRRAQPITRHNFLCSTKPKSWFAGW